jgi:hypothetical protein
MLMTDEPLDWAYWCSKTLGPGVLQRLEELKRAPVKITKAQEAEIAEHYRSEHARMVRARDGLEPGARVEFVGWQ